MKTYCVQCGGSTSEASPTCPRCAYGLGEGEAWELDAFLGRVVDGRYRVEERLGHGNFGILYRVVHVELGDARALKRPHLHIKTDSESMERFRREATTLAALRHPNIVGIEHFGHYPRGRPYIVMEYVDGPPLDRVLAAQGRLQLARAVSLIRQAALALLAAHERDVLHRDLKPGNLMITTVPGLGETVKVVDFGLARLGHSGTVTQIGAFVGTPDFMAPEQWQAEPLGPAADVYSLGVCLYQCLTSRLPFEDLTERGEQMLSGGGAGLTPPGSQPRHLGEAAHRIIEAGFIPASQVAPEAGIPAVLDQLLADVITADISRRVQTAHALILRLDQVTAALGGALHAPQQPAQTWTGHGAALGGDAIQSVRVSGANAPSRRTVLLLVVVLVALVMGGGVTAALLLSRGTAERAGAMKTISTPNGSIWPSPCPHWRI